MVTYQIHLIRAGTTSVQLPPPYIGQQDPPLHPEGVAELEQLRQDCAYPSVEMVFASPLLRCQQTAEILYPDTWVETIEGLKDMGLGRFEGKTLEQLQDDPDFLAWLENSTQNPPPDGEMPQLFLERILYAFGAIFTRMMDERMHTVAVVTHGGVIMSLLAGAGLPKYPMQEWACAGGMGYTILFTPQMWMRDGCVEVFRAIPERMASDERIDDWNTDTSF